MGLFSWGRREDSRAALGLPARGDQQALRLVLAYHQASKHDYHRFAAGPLELDWETQPDPFRRYAGARLERLDRSLPEGPPWFEPGFQPGATNPRVLDRAALSQLLHDSLALSAWKRSGPARWALRVNPSSGNLHPTEGTLLCGPIPGLFDKPTVAHYAPREHALEVRAEFSIEAWRELSRGLPEGSVLVGLSSIHWREAWKYGERAFRYCQHDAGHAIAALSIAAAALGWRARLLEQAGTSDLARLLGVWRNVGVELEEAECLIAVAPQSAAIDWVAPPASFFAACERWTWMGTPNPLSSDHHEWPILEALAEATRKPAQPALDPVPACRTPLADARAACEPISLRAMIHQRRSAVSLDGRSGMARDAFYQTLTRTLPEVSPLVFAALPWRQRVHLLLFVHRVADLEPGLFLLARDSKQLDALRAAFDPGFVFESPAACPASLPLFRLRSGDARSLARGVSCQQDIAADGCFSLGMLAEFRASLESEGASFYRRLYWECGAIGQVLYLEAEALGLRGTGIGCFFDDPVHRSIGLRDDAWQSLYHFTLGRAVDDERLTTEPAYAAV